MRGRTSKPQEPTRRWQRRLMTTLCVWLTLSFAVGALTKFYWGETFFGPPYSEKFVDWGYPSWVRFIVGFGELVGAALLLVPRRRFMGATILVVITTGATVTHIVNHDPIGESVSAPLHLVLAGIVAWISRPVDWREFRVQPAKEKRESMHGASQ